MVGCVLFANTQNYFKHKLGISAITMVITLVAVCMLIFATQSSHAILAGYYLFYVEPFSMVCA